MTGTTGDISDRYIVYGQYGWCKNDHCCIMGTCISIYQGNHMGTSRQILEIAKSYRRIPIQGITYCTRSSYSADSDSSHLAIKAGSNIVLDV